MPTNAQRTDERKGARFLMADPNQDPNRNQNQDPNRTPPYNEEVPRDRDRDPRDRRITRRLLSGFGWMIDTGHPQPSPAPAPQSEEEQEERARLYAAAQARIDAAREAQRQANVAQLTRLYAQSIRARAEARRREWRAEWAARDTAPLELGLLARCWPRPTPQPVQRRAPGSLADPEVLLTTHPQGPGSGVQFHVGEIVHYSVAGRPALLGRVEGWRRWSTGYKYLVRWQVRRRHPQLGTVLAWSEGTWEVWEGFLVSDEKRVRGEHVRRQTTPLLPPPQTPSTP